MSSTPARLDPADRARQRDEDAQYYRQILHKFIAMATDLAEAVHRQALAEPAAAPQSAPQNQPEDQPAALSPSPSQAITFDRLARTVRRTIALARKLSEPGREAPGPKLRLKECPLGECPKQRRPDRAEIAALHAEPWAEPCERPEEPDFDADEDLDDDLDEQSLAYLIATLRHDNGLATLSDAELWQRRTRPSAQARVPNAMCDRCARVPGLTSAPPRTTQSTPGTPRPGTGPPQP